MSYNANNDDPIPSSEYPTLTPAPVTTPPLAPSVWEGYALLHPFSPLQSNSTPADKANPFFELCIAYIKYSEAVGTVMPASTPAIDGRTHEAVLAENAALRAQLASTASVREPAARRARRGA